jgi:hypothetical protein
MQFNREQISQQTIYDVIEPARRRFAFNNGWQLARHRFPIERLAVRLPPDFVRFGWNPDSRLLDHVECYRKNGRPAGLVAHSYLPDAVVRAEALARQLGLQVICCERSSWWYPGRSTLLVFVAPGELIIMPSEAEIAENACVHAAWEAELERRRLARERGEERRAQA